MMGACDRMRATSSGASVTTSGVCTTSAAVMPRRAPLPPPPRALPPAPGCCCLVGDFFCTEGACRGGAVSGARRPTDTRAARPRRARRPHGA
jgi:hypothetical protein